MSLRVQGSPWDLVALTDEHWRYPWRIIHQVLTRVAQRHRVLWVCPPVHVREMWTERHKVDTGLRRVLPGLWTWTPPIFLPVNYRVALVEDIVRQVRLRLLKRVLAQLGFVRPVLYLFVPYDLYQGWIGEFGERLVCYHIYDDFEGIVTGESAKTAVRHREKRLIERADVIFAHTRSIIEARGLSDRAIWIPNGVDFELFDRFNRDGVAVPDDIAAIPAPRIGYVGGINQKLDFGLLESVSRSRPEWSFVFAGPVGFRDPAAAKGWQRLTALPNVYVLGAKPRERLPAYMKALDVGLMCYSLRDWVVHGYPLKLHEYFACGLPVVSSDLMAVREFDGLLRIATTPDEWMSAIAAGLDEGRARAAERIAVARANSWDARVATVERAIAEAIRAGGGRR